MRDWICRLSALSCESTGHHLHSFKAICGTCLRAESLGRPFSGESEREQATKRRPSLLEALRRSLYLHPQTAHSSSSDCDMGIIRSRASDLLPVEAVAGDNSLRRLRVVVLAKRSSLRFGCEHQMDCPNGHLEGSSLLPA